MNSISRSLELLSPAANATVAKEAILHGADAVYIGAPSHGARKSAANSIEDIAAVVEFAHVYRAKVYVTVNTIIYEHELREVEKMIWNLWRVGVDAIIVQDMGILRLNLPPIALHASTQCDTRTVEKARFLEDAGFSQIVLARELTLLEITEICRSVSVPVECFVHGALCVSYSGVCHASQACMGRSANRGECSQMCRLPYTMIDSNGKKVITDSHLLSLKDFNLSDSIPRLAEAGVRSFKIEGRLKEVGYVKNVTAKYSQILQSLVEEAPERYRRSSFGESLVSFTPQLDKSFNRGFTHYFLDRRKPTGIYESRTPKSMGETIRDISKLAPGDGISWFDKSGVYQGMLVNRINGKIVMGPKGRVLPKDVEIHRTSDPKWTTMLDRPTATRKLNLSVTIDDTGVTGTDERGVTVRIPLDVRREKAEQEMDFRKIFGKLGNTPYRLTKFNNLITKNIFIPASDLTDVRRSLVNALDQANNTTYPLELRRKERREAKFPESVLTYLQNVANSMAEKFYRDHGVEKIEKAAELLKKEEMKGKSVMTTRHCILRENGCCKKETKLSLGKEPFYLQSGSNRFRLSFDCNNCEMHLIKE